MENAISRAESKYRVVYMLNAIKFQSAKQMEMQIKNEKKRK